MQGVKLSVGATLAGGVDDGAGAADAPPSRRDFGAGLQAVSTPKTPTSTKHWATILDVRIGGVIWGRESTIRSHAFCIML
jgi:hypothetical protein